MLIDPKTQYCLDVNSSQNDLLSQHNFSQNPKRIIFFLEIDRLNLKFMWKST